MYITSSGPESSPRIDFPVKTGAWYKLKSVVSGTNVKIYVDDTLVKEITMTGSGADAKSNNYVGIWCHNKIPIKGDSFQGKLCQLIMRVRIIFYSKCKKYLFAGESFVTTLNIQRNAALLTLTGCKIKQVMK